MQCLAKCKLNLEVLHIDLFHQISNMAGGVSATHAAAADDDDDDDDEVDGYDEDDDVADDYDIVIVTRLPYANIAYAIDLCRRCSAYAYRVSLYTELRLEP